MFLSERWRTLMRAVKTTHARTFLAYAPAGRAVWTPRQYDRFAREGYQKNVIAYRCIRMISEGAASVPWRLFRRRGGRLAALDAHPLLALLKRPNPTHGGGRFRERVFAFVQIAGNAYVEAVGPEGGAPRELWSPRPDRMKVVPHESGAVGGYEYTVGGRTKRWPVDVVTGRSPILHLKAFHPLDDWYGMSPVEAAAFSIDQHNAAGAWNQALLQNAGRPSGALVYTPGEGGGGLSHEQRQRLDEMLAEQWTGPRHAGRPLILEGGLDWKDMSLSPKEMDWLAGRDVSARDVANAFGVPAQLVGVPDAQTYANNREARLAMWEQVIIPLVLSTIDDFNVWLAPMFGDDLEFGADFDQVPALAPRRERLWERIGNANFLTINEKRATVGLGPVADGDTVLVPAKSRPLGAASATRTEPSET